MSVIEKYYVYAYLRDDNTPYYIGKGQGKRAWNKCKGETFPPKNKSLLKIIAHRLSEHEAFLLETKLIQFYGRKDLGTGILRNKSDGGEGIKKPYNKIAWNKGLSKADIRVRKNAEGISKALKGKTSRNKGHSWFNNTVIELMSSSCPTGFIKGRLNNKGYSWFNNNVIELMSNSCPDGFIKGRLKK